MFTKQTIAIIGSTGAMGSAIAGSLAGGHYRLLLQSFNLFKVHQLALAIREKHPSADIEVLDCSKEASWEADVIILAVPFHAEKEVASKIKGVSNQKIVVSIANPIDESFESLVTSSNTSAAEELQKLLPNARVVKAFNTTLAADFATPEIQGQKLDAFVAGDDEDAVGLVQELVKTSGFQPMLAGKLEASRTLEHMQLMLIQLAIRNNYDWLAGWKILHN